MKLVDSVPDIIHFLICGSAGIEPATPWLVVRHADHSNNEAMCVCVCVMCVYVMRVYVMCVCVCVYVMCVCVCVYVMCICDVLSVFYRVKTESLRFNTCTYLLYTSFIFT